MDNEFFVYVLISLKDHTTYIGYCEDLDKRISEHNAGKTKSIKHKLPMKLVYYEAYETKALARKREIELKKNSFAKEQLYKRIFDK
ncbi:MAG: GIY-YIG nuclease family protein [Cyclobacteriaceae bacterium]